MASFANLSKNQMLRSISTFCQERVLAPGWQCPCQWLSPKRGTFKRVATKRKQKTERNDSQLNPKNQTKPASHHATITGIHMLVCAFQVTYICCRLSLPFNSFQFFLFFLLSFSSSFCCIVWRGVFMLTTGCDCCALLLLWRSSYCMIMLSGIVSLLCGDCCRLHVLLTIWICNSIPNNKHEQIKVFH